VFGERFKRPKKSVAIIADIASETGGNEMLSDPIEIDEIERTIVIHEEVSGVKISVTAIGFYELVKEREDFFGCGRRDRFFVVDGFEKGGKGTVFCDENGLGRLFKEEKRNWSLDPCIVESSAGAEGSMGAREVKCRSRFFGEGGHAVDFSDEFAIGCLEAVDRLVLGFMDERSMGWEVEEAVSDFGEFLRCK